MEEIRARLRQAEEQSGDMKERLRSASNNVEQYRAMVLSLEESLSKEKQVSPLPPDWALHSLWTPPMPPLPHYMSWSRV